MSRPIILGLRGRAFSGKTTLANYMAENTRGVTRLSFAGPLKSGLASMGISKESTPELYRRAAQWLGTDLARNSDPDHWVKLFKKRAEEIAADFHTHYTRLIVVDDVRFENEIAACDYVAFLSPTFPLPSLPPGTEAHESERLALEGARPDELVLHNDRTPLALTTMSANLLNWINP